MLQGLQIREKEKKKRKNNMKKLLVLFAIVAIAMTGLFATDTDSTLTLTLSPSSTEDKFSATIVAGALDSYPTEVTPYSTDTKSLDPTNGVSIPFTVLWDMTTSTSSPAVSVKVKLNSPVNNELASDKLTMTATTAAFYPDKAPAKEGKTPTVNIDGATADTIVSFAASSVSVVKSQGGVAITLAISADAVQQATAGATYGTTVTVTASTN